MSENRGEQPALITALLNRQVYDHPVDACELIETHISWVILAGEYVYKLKKPLNLGFLDFSTLERRRFFCEEELRLNRRLAPAIYLDVVAIGGTPGQPVLGASEGIFEYAVKMRRFAQSAQLDRMLLRGELQREHIDAFARMVAEFHQRVAVAKADSEFGTPAAIRGPMEENFTQIREHQGEPGMATRLAELEQWSQTQFARLHTLMQQRHDKGFVRECHGDMHLRNLAWIDSRAVAFDCIEFNPNLRWIDVISEVAFLIMDLQERGEAELAQRFLNAYLERTGDYRGLALMPFYLVYRALVRAKVAAIRSDQPQIDDAGRAEALREHRNYLALAAGYTEQRRPAVIVARGMSASGKTTLTAPLVEQLGAIRLRSDVERKRLHGLAAEADAGAAPGKGIYSAGASERTYAQLAKLAGFVLEAGYPVIIDAVCMRREQRQRFVQLARLQGVPCLILEFTAPADVLRRRIVARQKEASDADISVLEHQLQHWEPLEEDEESMALRIDTERLAEPQSLAAQVRAQLERPGA